MGCVCTSLRGAFSASVSNMSPLELIKLISVVIKETVRVQQIQGKSQGPHMMDLGVVGCLKSFKNLSSSRKTALVGGERLGNS